MVAKIYWLSLDSYLWLSLSLVQSEMTNPRISLATFVYALYN